MCLLARYMMTLKTHQACNGCALERVECEGVSLRHLALELWLLKGACHKQVGVRVTSTIRARQMLAIIRLRTIDIRLCVILADKVIR